jgi:hypothetical protein
MPTKVFQGIIESVERKDIKSKAYRFTYVRSTSLASDQVSETHDYILFMQIPKPAEQ